MPELPSITVYVERLAALAGGHRLDAVRLASPFLLRSHEPPLRACHGERLLTLSRLLESNWPRTLEELEEHRRDRR